VFLRDIHSKLLAKYICKEGCDLSQSQTRVGTRGGRTSQDGVSQEQEDAPLFTFAVSRRAEQFCLRTQQRIVSTVKDSVLRTEIGDLESQEEDAPKRVLWYTPMTWG